MDTWIAAFASPQIDWSILQAFRGVADAGSFRSAAVGGPSLNRLRARVSEAERIAGRPLLERSVAGVIVTVEGRLLLDRVKAMAGILSDDVEDRSADPS